jgi:hypothetical protein
MNGGEWSTGKWQDVPWLISQTNTLYQRLVSKGLSDKITATKKKIISERGWEPCAHLIEKNFIRILEELNYFYVPKGLVNGPGPCFIFPQRDLTGAFTRAQTRPLYKVVYNTEEGESTAKYCVAGCKKDDFNGPIWLGNDPRTLQMIVELGWVIIVEGPFDLLACRLLCPDTPFLCSMTKNIGERHEDYLRMMGVTKIFLMYDNEAPKAGKDVGAGNLSMWRIQNHIKWCQVDVILSPAEDASACLKNPVKARLLKSRILSAVPVSVTHE